MKITRILVISLCFLSQYLTVRAATVNQANDCPFGTHWHTTLPTLQVWNPDGLPSAGNAYVSAGKILRSPDSGTSTEFGGDSLTLGPGTTLALKGTDQTVTDLHLAGGQIAQWKGDGAGSRTTVRGGLTVDSDSSIELTLTTRYLTLATTISGAHTLTVKPSNGGVLDITGTNNTYTGRWVVSPGSRLNVAGEQALGSGRVLVTSGASLGFTAPRCTSTAHVVLESGATLDLARGLHHVGALTVGDTSLAENMYTAVELNALTASTAFSGTGLLAVGSPGITVFSPEADTYLRRSDDGPHGTEEVVHAKRTDASTTTRKGIIRFNIGAVSARNISDVRMHLTLHSFNDINGATSAMFNVFGIADGHAVESFLENDASFTYGDMPGLDDSSNGIDDTDPVWQPVPAWLGNGVLLLQFPAGSNDLQQVVTVAAPRLTEFVRQDANGIVTIFLTRETFSGSLNSGFVSREHPTLAPARLALRGGEGTLLIVQ